jgi:hypothetical protein
MTYEIGELLCASLDNSPNQLCHVFANTVRRPVIIGRSRQSKSTDATVAQTYAVLLVLDCVEEVCLYLESIVEKSWS